ncbi:hypothetical protein Aduo_006649 [Ancylostoma duodenale]
MKKKKAITRELNDIITRLLIAASIIVLVVVVAVSIFAYLFIRSKRAEMQKPHRRRRAPKQEKPKPKAAKMKAAKIDMKEFKAGRLVMKAKFEGEVKHDLDDEQSKAISNVAFDPKQNSIAFIGTTIEKLEGQSQMTATGTTERLNPQDASQLKVSGISDETHTPVRDSKVPAEEKPTVPTEEKPTVPTEEKPTMSRESRGSPEGKPSKSRESKESVGSAEGKKSKNVNTTENKVPIVRGLILLLLIAACLLGAAVVVALFLWLVSKKLPSIRERDQDLLIDEKDEQPNDKKRQEGANAAEPKPNLMRTNLNTGKSYGLHALDNDDSHSIRKITFDTDPTHVERNGSSADYLHINAVYTPTKNHQQKSPHNASANAKRQEEHPKVEKKVMDEKTERSGTNNSRRLPTNFEGKLVDTEPLMPRMDKRSKGLFNTSDKSKRKLGDASVAGLGNEAVQDNTDTFKTPPEDFSDMRKMKGNAAEIEPSPSGIRPGSRREDRKIGEILDVFEP